MEHCDEYAHADDVVFSDYISSWILCKDSVMCVVKGDILKSESTTITVNDTEYTVHQDVTLDELEEFLS
jgi:hypothetical protein